MDDIEVGIGEKENDDIKDIIADILMSAESDVNAIKMLQHVLPDDPDIIDLFVLQLGLALCQKFYQQLRNLTKNGGRPNAKKLHMPKQGDHKH